MSIGYKKRRLFVEEIAVEDLAKEHGTPLYVYSRGAIVRNYGAFVKAFSKIPHLICYAMKANANRAILRVLAREGSGADVVSGGELYQAIRAGIRPQKIVFSGVGKIDNEIEFGIRHGILMFNVESGDELSRINRIAVRLKRRVSIALRINPDVDPGTHPYIATGQSEHKFGIPMGKIPDVLATASSLRNVQMVGIHVHLGSQIMKLAPYRRAFRKVLEMVDDLQGNGRKITHIDLGGGFGIPYKKADECLQAEQLAELVQPELRKRQLRLILEPGRSITGNAGILVTRVLYVKKGMRRTFIVVDAGMNDLIRPSLYQAYHEILPVRSGKTPDLVADIVGPVCETGDFLARGRRVQRCEAEDLLAVMNAGAYGFSMSSNYNGRLRPAEVIVDGNRSRLVRKRETYEDLTRTEVT